MNITLPKKLTGKQLHELTFSDHRNSNKELSIASANHKNVLLETLNILVGADSFKQFIVMVKDEGFLENLFQITLSANVKGFVSQNKYLNIGFVTKVLLNENLGNFYDPWVYDLFCRKEIPIKFILEKFAPIGNLN